MWWRYSPAALRWVGLAGTGLLAAGGYLAGALPGAAPAGQAEALWGTGPGFRVGLFGYLAGLAVLGWAWWRLGALLRAETGPPLPWVLVTGALWAVPLLVVPPLGSRDVYAYACQGAIWLDGHDPYAVGVAGGGCPWLASVPDLWHETTAPYGPLALVVAAAAAALARVLAGLVAAGDAGALLVAVGALRAAAVAGALLIAAFGPRLARACGVAPATAAWLGLVTPLVAVHAVAGAHHDSLVAGLLVAALALAVSRRPAGAPAAGVALGLAVAVKVTAVAALPFALLLAAGRGGRAGWRGAGLVAGGAAVAFAALTLVTGLGTGWTGALGQTGSLAQWSSLPTGLGMAVGYALWGLGNPGAFDTTVAVARLAGLAVLAGFSAVMLLRAGREWVRHRTGTAGPSTQVVVASCGTVLAAAVVLGPVVYPWYAVAPLAVLAASIRHARAVSWLAVATVVLTALTLPSGLGVPVLTRLPGAVLVALGVVALSGWWLRRWWRPRRRGGPRRRPRRAPAVPVR